MIWISKKESLPTDTLNDNGGAKYCVVTFDAAMPDNIVPFRVMNAEYARLHPEDYDYWARIEEPPSNLTQRRADYLKAGANCPQSLINPKVTRPHRAAHASRWADSPRRKSYG